MAEQHRPFTLVCQFVDILFVAITTGGDTPQDAAGNAAFEVGFCTNQPVAAKMHATVGGFDERGTVVGELLRQNGFKSARAGSKKFLRRFDLHQFTQAQKDAG